jgi:hypothetical protein
VGLIIGELGLNRTRLEALGKTTSDDIGFNPMDNARGPFHGVIAGMGRQHRKIDVPPAIDGGDIPRGRTGLLIDVGVR